MLVSDWSFVLLVKSSDGVLILVLVDVGLGLTTTVYGRTCVSPVLILVLVDVGLGPPAKASSLNRTTTLS